MSGAKILLVGSGAREHIIAEKLFESKPMPHIYSYMSAKNPGVMFCSDKDMIGKMNDVDSIVTFAKQNKVDFVVIGPEIPIEAGVTDALRYVGIRCVGPRKVVGQLETSKSFTRDLVAKYDIPGNPKFKIFESIDKISEFMDELGDTGFVIKPDGLTGGKGVKVLGEHLKGKEDSLEYCKEIIIHGSRVIVEEKFVGEEFSLMSFVDGKTVVDMPAVQDHKRAFNGDTGPNTGGMGSYSGPKGLLPFLNEKHIEDAHNITVKVMEAIKKETDVDYKGIMYGGFIATKNGVRLIEYNARFGDPEAMNVLTLLKTDFVKVCTAIVEGTLGELKVEFSDDATVCKYVVPNGYPDNPEKNEKIEIPKPENGAKVYYAAIDKREGALYMTGSRAVAFVGRGASISDAEKIAEDACNTVTGTVRHRTDIGTDALVQKRIDHMDAL
ncbi:MAG: phosphoribosylamine--glycine ligase [Candidatus Aenigmarchaeota archaeon]|nr:phosphoribosylamine--glycine ligase [Candidatus Aenigmarchaeota archaeon]